MFSYHPYEFNPEEKFGYSHGWYATELLHLTQSVWSPIVWNEGIRAQKNFKSCEWLVMDFDEPSEEIPSLRAAMKHFCNTVHVIGITKSHLKAKNGVVCDRFRVALQFEKPITDLRTYRWNMKKAVACYGADKACIDGARFYYPCKARIREDLEGYLMEVDEDVPDWFEQPVDIRPFKEAGILPIWLMQKLLFPFPSGHKNTTCYQVAKDLTKLGYDQKRIVELILNNPCYRDGVSEALHREICQAVKSGSTAVGGTIF